MKYIKRFIRQDRDYFTNNWAEIQERNFKILRIACVAHLLILAIYTVVTAIEGRSGVPVMMCYAFDAAHVLLCAVVFDSSAAQPRHVRRMNVCRVLFEISVLAFFVLEAVFPYPDQQSIYLPFPIILFVMAFIYRVGPMLLLVFGYVLFFILMIFLFKSPAVRASDMYMAVGTLVSALAGYAVAASLRHETSGAMGRLRYLSMTDPMTGLYNKQTLESLCEAYMQEAAGNKGYALLFLDVDNFKQINDRYGHPAGDAALKTLADVMRGTFYEKDYLCRFGGDEFVIFMVDIRSEADVRERVRVFESRVASAGNALGIGELSCSVGIAMKGGASETYAELLSRADAALYVAKEKKKPETEPAAPADEPATPAADMPAPPPGERKVLIVDDNELNRLVLRQILSLHYEVLEAENGQEAFDILQRRHAEISAVLLDIVMPVMDGYELLALMRHDQRLASMPVIITTGYGEDETEIRALALGANDFVVKPYRPAIIMHRLQNTIRLAENR